MTLRNFEVDLRQTTSDIRETIVVEETVTVARKRETVRKAYEGRALSSWTWRDVRDYVVFEIEARFGVIPNRDAAKEYGIFNSFCNRWGDRAPRIAKYVFERLGGRYNGEPVTIERFSKGADPYFSAVIAPRIPDTAVGSW